MTKIISIVGARPNFMKIAPLCRVLARRRDVENLLVHTGQHYDEKLSRVFFEELGIPRPDVDLGVGSGPRDEQIARIRDEFEPVLRGFGPDIVLVVGDVNSTIACAEVAHRLGVRVAHVEAGLRSFDQDMPEEHNRIETDRISDDLFVTEESGMRNLEREGVPGRRHLVGNVMIDTLIANLDSARESGILGSLGVEEGRYFVATFHRPSNVDDRDSLSRLLDTVAAVCERGTLVLPLHPRTAKSLESHRLRSRVDAIERLVLCDPLGYLDFLRLVMGATAVITDSGGIQEETTYLGVPCLTMRENTERPVTIDVGSNTLVGSDSDLLLSSVDRIIEGRYKSGRVPALWDGHAAERIAEILLSRTGESGV